MKSLALVLVILFQSWCFALSQQTSPVAESFPTPIPNLKTLPGASDSCPLAEVLQSASSKTRTLVDSLQQFSATELVEHSELDKSGKAHAKKTATFNYVAEIRDMPAFRVVNVEEYRDGSAGVEGFPTQLATKGLSAFALIFHPNYIQDFSMTCEGLIQVQGRPAWQVRFSQRRANAFRLYNVHRVLYRVKLQGHAWIAAESGNVLRLDSQLLEPLPEIQLKQEHVTIDYRAIDFPKHSVQLWLPEVAEITIDFRSHSYHQRHAFSDFQLFWVDTGEQRQEPQLMPGAAPNL